MELRARRNHFAGCYRLYSEIVCLYTQPVEFTL
jgi:hypothetical protein